MCDSIGTIACACREQRRHFGSAIRYNDSTNDYTQLASVPVRVDDTVAGVYEDRYIYLVSGWGGADNVLDVQVYDTQTDVWQAATPLPGPATGLFGHSGTIVGDKIVTFDGTRTDGGFRISDVVLSGTIDPTGTGDVTEIAWQTQSPHPGQPTYRAAVSQGPVSENRLLLLGGTDNPYNFDGRGYDGQPSLPLQQAMTFDVESNEWSLVDVEGSPLATMDHRGLVAVPGGWATVGGMVGPGILTDEVVHYRLGACVPEPTSVWLLAASAMIALTALRSASVRGRRRLGVRK